MLEAVLAALLFFQASVAMKMELPNEIDDGTFSTAEMLMSAQRERSLRKHFTGMAF